MNKTKDIRNQKFGFLTVKSFMGYSNGNSLWECKCVCGTKVYVLGYNLKSGHTMSCGCSRIKALKKTATKHGMYGQRFYNIWRQILRRCNEPNHKAFKNYGGRGIQNLWKSFDEFKFDMYRSYISHVSLNGEKNTTIDRKDANGHYSAENCRWATWKVQANNKRK